MKRRRKVEEGPDGDSAASQDTKVMEAFKSVVAHLAVRRYDDGTARSPGTLLVKTVGKTWQLTAKDPDTCQQLRVVQHTWDDAWVMLALLLDSEDAPWEPDPWAKPAHSKKKSRK